MSAIDITKPVSGNPTTQSVRDNFAATASEIDALDAAVTILQGSVSGFDSHLTNTNNPHAVTKTQIGLGNVDNTSDVNKPISTATQTALNSKADSSALSAHVVDTGNPHATTAAQVGAVSTGAVTTSGLTMSTGKLLGRTTAGTGAIEEITLGTAAPLNVSTDGTLAANSDTLISTQKAVKTYAEKFVVGPASAVDSRVATFDGVSGKLIKDSGMAVSVVGNAVRLTNTGTTTGVANMFEFQGPGYYGPPVLWTFDNIGQISHSFGSIRFALGGTASTAVTGAGVGLQDSSVLGWAGLNPTSTVELAIARTAADVMSVTDGASGFRDVKLRSLISSGGVITLSASTVAGLLSATLNPDSIAVVTDASSPVLGSAVVGGGSTRVLVQAIGSNWVVIGGVGATGGTGDFKSDGTVAMTGTIMSVLGSVTGSVKQALYGSATWNDAAIKHEGLTLDITDIASDPDSYAVRIKKDGANLFAVYRHGQCFVSGRLHAAQGCQVVEIGFLGRYPNSFFGASSGGQFGFSANTGDNAGVNDTAIQRAAPGVTMSTDGAGNLRDHAVRSLIATSTIILGNVTVATLPTAASNTHAIVAVTDGNASPTYRGAVTGGGSTKGVVYCDGSSWMWH